MTTHSRNHNGAHGQHPRAHHFRMNADFTVDPLICGFEWNVQDHKGQIGKSLFRKNNEKPTYITRPVCNALYCAGFFTLIRKSQNFDLVF